MGKALVVFGSESDETVYGPLMEKLRAQGIEARLEVCSAHRNPEKLVGILQGSEERIVVAGAGLSAALPGFIASHSDKLVIGVPVKANYAGLDSLMSIHQMPKGFAVLGTGVEALDEAVEGAEKILNGVQKVVVVKPESSEALKRFNACEEKLKELGIAFELKSEHSYSEENTLYIDFVELRTVQEVDNENKLVVFVPVEKDSRAEDALKLMALTKKGLWVGLGRAENAAIAAAKIVKGGG